jgi:hypothetical protein
MATAYFTPAEKAYLAKQAAEINAKINDASEKEAQNYETITELVKKILDLGGVIPAFEEPLIKENQKLGTLSRRLDCLQKKNQWLEKKIQEYGELLASLKNR